MKVLISKNINQLFTAVVAVLIIVSIVYLDESQKISRDQQKINDIKKIQLALDKFYEKHQHYPDSPPDGGTIRTVGYCDRWDLGFWEKDGSDGFISLLVEEGFLDKSLGDPIFYGRCDAGYFYHRYYCNNNSPYYPCYGCNRPFYILGIKKLESKKTIGTNRPINSYSFNSSDTFKCPNRDWSNEFDYVVGKAEK